MEKEISISLERYSHLKPPNHSIRKAVQKVIKEEFDEDLDIGKINFIRNTVFIKTSGVLTSELALNKELLLDRVGQEVGLKPTGLR